MRIGIYVLGNTRFIFPAHHLIHTQAAAPSRGPTTDQMTYTNSHEHEHALKWQTCSSKSCTEPKESASVLVLQTTRPQVCHGKQIFPSLDSMVSHGRRRTVDILAHVIEDIRIEFAAGAARSSPPSRLSFTEDRLDHLAGTWKQRRPR